MGRGTPSLLRRDLLGVAAIAAVTGAAAGCDAKSAHRSSGRAPSPTTASAKSEKLAGPTAAAAKGELPEPVLHRLSGSDVPVDLTTRRDLHSATTSRVRVVGDIDPFYVKLAASYAQATVDYFEPLLMAPMRGTCLVLLARNKDEYVEWGGVGPSDSYGHYVVPRRRRSQGWVVMNGGLPWSSSISILTDSMPLEFFLRAHVFRAVVGAGVESVHRVPRWMTDGFMSWAQATIPWAEDNLSSDFVEHPPPPTVPTRDAEFAHDPHGFAAGRAFLFVYYLAVTYGEATTLGFYEQMLRQGAALERKFKRVFGVSFAAAQKAWAAQYKRQVSLITGV